ANFFMEYDTARAGDFRPLRHLPADKTVVLGLVSTKTPRLEAKDDLKRRIDEAARYVPLERLCLSPQCGFASNFAGNPLTIDDERRKLALVVETAREMWGGGPPRSIELHDRAELVVFHAGEIVFGIERPRAAEEELLECPRRLRTRRVDDPREGDLHEKPFRARNRHQLEVAREYPRPVGNKMVLREGDVGVAARHHLGKVAVHDAETAR